MAHPTLETIAVLTASSTSGKACVSTLLSSPTTNAVRAIFRSESKAAPLRTAHANDPRLQIHTGVDAQNPQTVQNALSGCTVAFLITPHDPARGYGDDADLVANMIHAAVAAGVRHVIFGASWTVSAKDRVPTIASRFAPGEALLKELELEAGLKWTVIRGGFFLDNYANLMGGLKASDEVHFVDFCVPANDPRDIGRVAAAVADVGGKGFEGKVFEISGPERFWMRDAVRTVAEVVGRELRFVELSIEEVTEVLPPFMAELFKYLVERGEEAVPLSKDVELVTGKPAVSLREWVSEHKDQFILKDTEK